jgi:predicted PurR-regulated permease PerM
MRMQEATRNSRPRFGRHADSPAFLPAVGPIAAAIPGVPLGFSQGTMTALYVLLFYLGVQQVESDAIMPLVQRAVVSLPPIVALFAVIGFGLLLGKETEAPGR